MNEKDLEMILTKLAHQEGWSNDEGIVKIQQMWEPMMNSGYSEMKKAHMATYDNEGISIAVWSGETETSQGSPLAYTERDTSQAATNTGCLKKKGD